MLDQMAQAQQAQQQEIANRAMTLREQEAARSAEEFKQSQAERQAATVDRSHVADVTNAMRLAPALPMDQNVSPDAAGIMNRGGLGGQLYTPPTAGTTETGQTFESSQLNPSMNLGTAPQQDAAANKQIIGRIIDQLPEGDPRRLAMQYAETGRQPVAGMFDKPAPVQKPGQIVQNDKGEMVRVGDDNAITPLGIKGYHPPPASAAAGEKLTRVEHKDPETGRTVIEYLPQSAIKGQKFEKGVLGATESRLASAEAVKQTGDDMIANISTPAVRAQLGPAMGRYNTLKDFIGNPPPEYAELAGQIESYSLANMGVHGMRSAQGSRMIAELLNQHHTPESLVASIKGLNSFAVHFMENEGRKVTGGNAAPIPGSTDAAAPAKVEKWGRDASGKLVKQ
jgi:hypothetical protein